MRISILAATLAVMSVTAIYPSYGEAVDQWGPCPALPAVVHPVTVSPLQQVLSLRGDWEFVTDPMLMGRHRMGKGPGWNEPNWTGSRSLAVPGCWEAQGVGEPGMSQPWDPMFDRIPRPINHLFMGTARYRRSVQIPAEWAGKNIWLKVGGVRTEAWFWVNQQRVAHLNTYCGAYKYDITSLVKPGEAAEIVATVRNDSPSRKGCMAAYHRFGGFYRDFELEATPPVRIDDVWVRGNIDLPSALVNISLRGAGKASGMSVDIRVKSGEGAVVGEFRQPVSPDETGLVEFVCEVPMPGACLWTPETPCLYIAEVTLLDGDTPVHGWNERFGLRRLEVRGNRFFLNNVPFLARGYGDDYIYPLTLVSPPEREEHVNHLRLARKAGFNYVRHHTHCEIPEFFEAADEAGILVQPELPYYHDITTEGFEFDPMRDLQELYRHYRRYVSFASYSLGNEGHLGSPLDQELYQWAKANDPDRIFQHQDGGCNMPGNSDYYTPNGYGLASSINPWEPGVFDALQAPFMAHEYLNLGIKMDPRIAPKFTGAIPSPRSLEAYEESLKEDGLDRAWGDACLDAAHALQGHYQKQGIERARMDPACDGYSYWTIVDVMVEQAGTYTGQGFLNAFWEEKSGGLTLEQFARFNGPDAVLARIEPEGAIASEGDACTVALWVSHFSAGQWLDKRIVWRLKSGENVFAEGMTEPVTLAPGDVRAVGEARFVVPEMDVPMQVFFEARVEGTDISNGWDMWFFPKRETKDGAGIAVTEDLFNVLSTRYRNLSPAGAGEAGIVIGSWDHPDLLNAVNSGKRGIMIGPADGEPNVSLGWWALGDQVGTAFAKHPVYGNFPHNGKLSPLWFRLIKRGLPLPVDPRYGECEYFSVGEGQTQYFAYIMKRKQQPLLMTCGVDLLAMTPEGAYLLDEMIGYARSDGFAAEQAP